MATNIIVVEDESIVRKDIERNLIKLGYNIVGLADTGEKAIELALANKPDVILMDIMLKGKMTGIEAAAIIKEQMDVPIIFLTAYADTPTLNKAKQVEPHGYILKPFKETDVHTTIEMAIHKHGKEKEIKIENEFLKSLTSHNDSADYLFVKNNARLVRLKPEDVMFVEALKDYVVINTKNDRYTIHSTMKEIERKLPERVYQRAHRSFIVNMDCVAAIEGSNLIMEISGKEIPIGGSYKDAIAARINVL